MRLYVHCPVGKLAPIVCMLLVCSVFVLDIGGQSLSVQDDVAVAPQAAGTGRTSAAPAGQSPVLKARLEQMYAKADFNGDGLQDVAVVDFLTDSVRVMTAEAGGTFRTTATLAARRGPRSIVAADFNGDGVSDLAVAEFLSGEVSVFRGQANGQFQAARVVRVGEGINSMIAQDLDGDARPDIVAANALSGAVLLLKNAGNGSFDAPAEIGRTGAVTILSVDVDDDGVQDLAALSADGTDARVFAGRGAGRFAEATAGDVARVLSAATAGVARGITAASIDRLNKMAGDGVAQHAGTAAAEPLVVEVLDSGGTPVRDGQIVVFSRVGGNAESAEPGALPGRIEDLRATNEQGRASLALTVPGLPEVSVIAAALPADQVVHFGVISTLTQEELASALEAALALEVSDDIEREERIGLLQKASERLDQGDAIEGVRVLGALLNQLPSEQTGAPDAARSGAAADLSRRFINQVLLTGVTPTVAENELLPCDVPLTRTIASFTEIDRFTFACQAGEVVNITLSNDGGATGFFIPVWRLIGPDGAPAGACGAAAGPGGRDCTVTVPGIYAVEVSDNDANGTGTYSLHLQRLTAAQRCSASLLACDTPLTTTIDSFADTDLHGFTGVAGEVVNITLSNNGGATGFFIPVWRLIAADGKPAAVCGTFTGPGQVDCTLPADGAYAVEVRDNDVNGTGTYSLQLQRLTAARRCSASPLACDTPVTTTIDSFADTDLHGFTGVAGEVVNITLSNNGGATGFFIPVWRLIAADGKPAAVCGTFTGPGQVDCTLPADGAYAVEVRDNDVNGTGTYSLQLQRLTAARRCSASPLACDTPVTTTIDSFADTDLHGFTGVAGEVVNITLSNNGGATGFFIPVWRLIAADGKPAAVCGTFTGPGQVDCTLPADGAFAVEVRDNDVNGTGSYSLQLQRLTAGQRCGGSLNCGVAVTATIETFADTDLHSFSGVPGNVHISLANNGGSSGFFIPVWRLIAPNGKPAAVCGSVSGPGEFDCALSEAGGYAVEVRDNDVNGTGTYRLTVSGPGCISPPDTGLPPGWLSTDIGAVGRAGSATESGGTFTVRGAGADVWGTADAFQYAYRPLTGDGQIVARVATLSGTQPWAKAGVMIRETLNANAAHAFMLVSTGNGLAFQRRKVTGGLSTHTGGGSGTAPRWVRLVRSGTTITASSSTDGTTWTVVGSDTFSMATTVQVGLAVSSHDTSQLATATFDNVTISSTPLPPGWTSTDIGVVGRAGSATESGGTFTVRGAGADVWGTADAFQYAYRPLTGDGQIVARVATLSGTQPWAKAGVMIRETLNANAAHAFMLVSTGNGLAFQRRKVTGGLSTHTGGGSGTAPRWVRLVRSGTTITASSSTDGTTWTVVGSDTFSMATTVQVGLAVSSHDTSQLATATFDNVTISSTPLPPGWTSTDIGAVGRAGSATESGGTFTVRGAGADVWGTADAFQYAYRPLTGDGQIVARVATLSGTQPWAKAGVMIRETLNANAAHAFMLVSTGNGLAFQRRKVTGGLSTHTGGGSGTAPRWVRLVRSGTTITASSSTDGTTWTVVGSDTFSMATTVQVGLAVSSHDTSQLATATFDNVIDSSNPPPPPPPPPPPSEDGTFEFRGVSQGCCGGPDVNFGTLAAFYRDDATLYARRGGAGGGRGINVIVIDPTTGGVIGEPRNFDTWGLQRDGSAMNAFVEFLEKQPLGSLIMIAVADEAGLNVALSCASNGHAWTERGFAALEALGARLIRNYCWRNSYALIAIKGEGAKDERLDIGGVVVTSRYTLTLP